MTQEKGTIQLGLRIDKDLLKKVEEYSKYEGIDKMSFIRRAINLFVGEVEGAIISEAIEDYVNLRTDEETLKRLAGFDKIPKDIQDARKDSIIKLRKK